MSAGHEVPQAAASRWLRAHGLLLSVCVAAALPLWLVRYPPMQDFPVHFATLRVLRAFHDPRFGFDTDYELTLGRTQYFGFYAVGYALAMVVGARAATLLLVSFYVAGTVVGMRSLLLALNRDERLAFAVLPALYGSLFAIGLIPFLFATPVTLWAIGVLVRRKLAPSLGLHLQVAALGLALFYLHVVHLGVFLLAGAVMFPLRAKLATKAGALLSFAPASTAVAWWLLATNVGRRIFELTTHWGATDRAPLGGAIADMHSWVADAYPDASDEVTFALVLFALVLASWLAFRDRSTQGRLETSQPSEPAWRVKGYWVLPVVCFLLYLTGERSRGPIWPLCQRYMQLGALLAVPLLGMPTTPRRRRAATAAIVATGLVCIANSAWHFVLFNREVGDLPGALTQMDPNKHVAALIYWPHAKSTRFWPFLHFGSYYQAEKGGVVDFSFAGYDQWPLSFRKGRFPLYDGPATPRWEFFPRDVVSHQPLDTYFDYALVRDRGDAPIPTGFRLRWRGSRWEVFERTP